MKFTIYERLTMWMIINTLLASTALAQSDTCFIDVPYPGFSTCGKLDKQGHKIGLWTVLNDKGCLYESIEYTDTSFIEKHYYCISPNELLLIGIDIGKIKNGKKTGESCYTSYHSEGNPSRITLYRDNKENGLEITFHENGDTAEVITWVNGAVEGEMRRYDESGVLRFRGFYLNNDPIGKFTTYHENGIKELEGFYSSERYSIINTRPDSTAVFIVLNQQGDTLQESDFTYSVQKHLHELKTMTGPRISPTQGYQREGTWQYWNNKGILIREEQYYLGNLVRFQDFKPDNE